MTSYNDKPWLKWYDEHVTAELPLPKSTFLDFLEKGLYADQEKPAFHFLGSTCTYRQLNDLSDRFARFLVDGGCEKGDVVGIHLPNIPQYLVALVGATKAGCVVTGVSPLLTPNEIVHHLNDSKAKALITMDIFFQQSLVGVANQIPDLKQIVVTNVADFLPGFKQFLGKLLKKIPTGEIVPLSGKTVISYKQLISRYPADKPKVDISPDDTFLLAYTGGTTGLSKGTVWTHKNLAFVLSQMGQWLNQNVPDNKNGQEIMCAAFPLFHAAGIGFGALFLSLGNAQILIPDPRNTDLICKDMKKYRPTLIGNVPTLYQMLMENPAFSTIDFSSVKICLSAAAPFDVDSIKRLESFVGKGKVVELYGMTEGFISMNPAYGKNKIGSVGIPVQNTKIKIVDVIDGKTEIPIGEPGELIVCGPQMIGEYYNSPEATKKTIKEVNGNKYLFTGDVARMDEDGFIYIVDRTKDMLLVGGYNVYSKQVEDILYEIPEIEICAIIGEPNPDRPGSDIVKAVIQLRESDKGKDKNTLRDKITAHCKEKMSPYKVPKIIKFMDEIPLTSVGKVDKKVLRN